jgi:hypothetical protein
MRAAARVGIWAPSLLLVAFALGGCQRENPRVGTRLNDEASLQGELPFNPLRDRVITSWMDRSAGTMSTLYGNDVAIEYARRNAGREYPSGAVLSLVTWSQQEDPRWFGGRIPGSVASVEFVTVGTDAGHHPSFAYRRYEGKPLRRVSQPEGAAGSERAAFLISQRAAVMP